MILTNQYLIDYNWHIVYRVLNWTCHIYWQLYLHTIQTFIKLSIQGQFLFLFESDPQKHYQLSLYRQ